MMRIALHPRDPQHALLEQKYETGSSRRNSCGGIDCWIYF